MGYTGYGKTDHEPDHVIRVVKDSVICDKCNTVASEFEILRVSPLGPSHGQYAYCNSCAGDMHRWDSQLKSSMISSPCYY